MAFFIQLAVLVGFFCFDLMGREALAETLPVTSEKVAVSGAQAGPQPENRPARSRKRDTPAHIYVDTCSACHREGNMDAPRMGSSEQWAPRIAKGIEALQHSALYGFNSMPPRGLCNRCTDDQIKATVEYMVEKSR